MKGRYTATSPCPICHGHDRLPRGHGERCAGFLGDDGRWAHCTREEHASALPLDQKTTPPSYLHLIAGPCRCGREHAAGDGLRTAPRSTPLPPIAGTHDYLDAAGALLYQTVRFEPKDFRQRRPDRQGGWIWKEALAGVDRVPYRLRELLTGLPGRTVFIVEGEKDADRLASLGLLATCNAGGTEKWTDALSEHLRGRAHIVVLADNDDPGRRHAQQVARSVTAVAGA